MKTLIVDMEAYFGCDSNDELYHDSQTVNIEVEDDIAETLQTMLKNTEPDENGELYISDDDLFYAVKNGHPELDPLLTELIGRCSEMEITYWCGDADDGIDFQILEESFYDDVKAGLYEPVDDDDFDPEVDGYSSGSAEACRNNYLAWVRSHKDDPYFVAERFGINPEELACDGYFYIKEIK